MKTKLTILFLSLNFFALWAQEKIQGEISFISGDNIYVRFADTRAISIGDTLFLGEESPEPCLVVSNKSSVSCIAKQIGACSIMKGQVLYIKKEVKEDQKQSKKIRQVKTVIEPIESEEESPSDTLYKKKEKIFGRVSAASYSILSPNNPKQGNTRLVGRAAFNMEHIAESDFSLETYFNYQENLRSYDNSRGYDRRFNVYNLALSYTKENYSISLGRKINRRASSLGAIDGLQGEYSRNGFFVGAIAGFRPDYQNFGINSDVLQYGAYLGLEKGGSKLRSQLSVGFLEQNNKGAVDRRFIYLQSNHQLGKRLNLFASTEVDLYENFDTASAQSTFKLSSLFLSSRLKVTDWFSLFASYDTRRQIIFFETYDTEVERLLANQEARQGLRARANFSLGKRTNLGLAYNYRFQQNSGMQGENVQAYISYNRLPWIGGTISYRFNINSTYYLRSEVNSARYARYFAGGKIYSAIYYRYLSYLYTGREIVVPAQAYYGTEFSYRLNEGWDLGALGEMSQSGQQTNYRINIRLTKRFKL